MVTPRFDAAQVRRYYDRHTAAFVSHGQGGSVGAIHRAVWGPGTRTRQDAFRYVEDQIAESIRRLPSGVGTSHIPHIVDLGCGVGGSLCYLAERQPIRGTGITLSPVQARLAEERIRQAGLSDRVICLEGDYCDLPTDLEPADLAYAIESFVHGPSPEGFFAQCARLIRPGGLLFLCDDFRRPVADPAAARAVERFRRGWHVNALLERDTLRAVAREAGFGHESTTDLSSYLELSRLRDRMIDLLLALFGWLPLAPARVDYVRGGSALQKCLAKGWIGYDLALFRRLS